MKLYHVTHSIVVEQRHAIPAKDDADLKRILEKRDAEFKTIAFKSKIERDDKGNPKSHQLSNDWDRS